MRFVVACLVIGFCFVSLADAQSTRTINFSNIADNINDLHIDFGGNTVPTPAPVYTGGPAGTQFASINGLGTSSIQMSGATVSNPGYTQYQFTFAASSYPGINSAWWTRDGNPIVEARHNG